MRKLALFLLAAFVVVGSTRAAGIGIGAYGGLNIPVLQDDQGSGTVFGLKARLKALSFISLEPNLNFAKYGEPDIEDLPNAGIDGAKITSYGIDAVLGSGTPGPGFKPYFVGGLGFYKYSQPDQYADLLEDETRFGYDLGIGVEIGFTPQIALDVNGKARIITLDGGGADKALTAVAGINYYFGL